ncbi:hypothetical protein [Paenibacillus hexagrammi]|uniref:DUF2334 domain-containing protein n=1 Tax=Paenibacillus hexagrammi TaxID=2908839 RepID=A0ABY3SSY1_9BACL|nr:hypothetical protein [Paenibacillus sp. YPD9-1]UJF36087.1 hypothetical protein L0M14_14030 [Paenibacillus sp. YPD9-1]
MRQHWTRKCWIVGMVLCLCLCLGTPLSKVWAADEDPVSTQDSAILLMYDSMGVGTPEEGNIEALERVLAAFGAQVTVTSFDSYEAGTLAKYKKVIAVRNAADLTMLPEQYEEDFAAYHGAYMHIGAHLPEASRQQLQLEEDQTVNDTINLTIGQLSQSSVPVQNMSYITNYSGTSYGSVTSEALGRSVPFGIMNGNVAYIPYMVKGNVSELGISYVLKDWLGITSATHQYVVFHDIYPFSDLDMLSDMADKLYDAGIPFIVSVQPVLSHLDYPSMTRYLETLKHVQSRNGSIVVNAPVVASTITQDMTVLKSEMSAFLDALAGYGVVPLGIGTELYWTFDQHYAADGLTFFDSGIVFPNERVLARNPSNTSRAFATSIYTIGEADLELYTKDQQIRNPLPMNTAVVYAFPTDKKGLQVLMDKLQSDWTAYSDYKNETHRVQTDTNKMESKSGHLSVNGQSIQMNDAMQDVSAEHVYVDEGKKSLTTLFSVQNNIFIVLILSTLLIFVAFLIIGYRLYKRKYTNYRREL